METTYDLTNNRKLEIVQDQNPESPRSWDNLSKMIFFGTHKHLGDKHDINTDDYANFREVKKAIERKYNTAIIREVYGYSHSGLTISLTPFSCPWDSGTLGFAVVTKEDMRKEYSIKNVTKKYLEQASKVIEGEVETLDQYCTGEVWGFKVLDEDENEEDSCYGFYGELKDNGILDYLSEEDRELVLAKL